MSIEEMYQSKLLDKLKEKFSDNELDLGLRGKEYFIRPANLKDALLHSKLVDRINEEIFNHLITQKRKLDYDEVMLANLLFPVWREEDPELDPLFFTHLSEVIYLATDHSGDSPKLPQNYQEAKKIAYEQLSPFHLSQE